MTNLILQRLTSVARVEQPGDHDDKRRRYSAVMMTGERITDWTYDGKTYSHQLDVTGRVRLDRMNSGRAPVLDSHHGYRSVTQAMGYVDAGSVKMTPKGLVGTFTLLPDSALPPELVQQLDAGGVKNLSIGAKVHHVTEQRGDNWRNALIDDWEPAELSMVVAGDDQGAQAMILQSLHGPHFEAPDAGGTGGGNPAAADADAIRAAERERVTGIQSVCQSIGIDPEPYITGGQSLDEVRPAIRPPHGGGPLRLLPDPAPPSTPVDEGAIRQAERDRIAAIRQVCQHPMANGADPQPFIDAGQSADQVRVELFNRGAPDGPDPAPNRQAAHTPTGGDVREKMVTGIQHAFLERAGAAGEAVARHEKLTLAPGEFRGISLIEAGRLLMGEAAGKRAGYGAAVAQSVLQHSAVMRQWIGIPGLSPGSVTADGVLGAQASVRQAFGGVSGNLVGAQGESDLSVVVEDLMRRTLSAAYAMEGDLMAWSRCTKSQMAQDFRPQNVVFLGAVPDFSRRREGGDFARGEVPNPEKGVAQVTERGQTIVVDRVTLINDDLGILFQTPMLQGQAAQRTKEKMFFAVLAENSLRGPTIAVSGTSRTLFHSAHGNIVSGAAASATVLNGMRSLMRRQKVVGDGAAGQEEIGGISTFGNLMLDTFLCSTVQESAIEIIRDSEKEPGTDNQNTQRGKFRNIVTSPILDEAPFTTNGLYLYGFAMGTMGGMNASPICHSYYGSPSPYLFMSEISVGRGMVWHAAVDVGMDAVNYRGAVLNPGA